MDDSRIDTGQLGGVRVRSVDERSAASLCIAAAASGATLTFDEIRELNEGRIPPMRTMLSLLGNARVLGLAPTPLEGEYEELTSLPGPSIVMFREEAREIFVVLAAIEDGGARIIDPLRGESLLSPERFKERWTGDVVVIQPDEEGRRRVEDELHMLRRRWPRAVFAASMVMAAIGVGGLVASPAEVGVCMLGAGVALAFVASVWLLLFGASCKVCSRGKVISGRLPLEWAGVALYGLLVPLALSFGFESAAGSLVCAAAGGHVFLMDLLRRNGVACKACLIAGTSVVLSALAIMATNAWPWGLAWGALGAAMVGLVVRIRVLGISTRSQTLGWETASDIERPARGVARLRVIKRLGCGACVLFETALRPALIERFGDVLEIEEGYSDLPLITPLIAGIGSELSVISVGLGREGREYDRLCRIVGALLTQASSDALDDVEDAWVRARRDDLQQLRGRSVMEPELRPLGGEGR